jgi:uncharacterized protein (TIGR03067 family)
MKRRLVLSILILDITLIATGAANSDDAADRKTLNGVWKGWVVEGKGDHPNQRRMAVTLTIKGNTITGMQSDGKDLGEGTYSLRTVNGSNRLDATRTANPGRGQSYNGIYSLERDTLRWCVSNPPGREAPSELQSKTGQFLMILQRQK